jgi:hypothetical protein
MPSPSSPASDPVTKVVVACCRHDVHLTRICVASIRYWYPDIPIFLLKDLFHGEFSTAEIEDTWNVRLFPTSRDQHGWGFGKFEAIFAPQGDRLLVLDADTAILGRVIDLIESHDADLVVSGDFVPDPSSSYMRTIYYDLDHVRTLDPEFNYPGFCFNSGHFAIRTGKLRRADFAGLVEWSTPPRLTHADKFIGGDQGILNFVAARKVRQSQLTLVPMDFARGGEDAGLAQLPLHYITRREGYPYIVHWSGLKPLSVALMPRSDLLRFYEAFYYSRLPRGGWTRTRRNLLHPFTAFGSTLNSRALRTRLKRTVGKSLRRVARSGPVRRLLASDRIYRAIIADAPESERSTELFLPHQAGPWRETALGLADLARRAELARRLYGQLSVEPSVKAGFFAGMRYPFANPARPNLFPKLLGTYGGEFHAHLSALSAAPLPVICDVGCGDGYLAVGLGGKHRDTKMYAFDHDPTARRDCQILAASNGVSGQLTFGTTCGLRELLALDFSHGGLLRLGAGTPADRWLTPELVTHLERAHLLLEFWDLPAQPLADEIKERLRVTHTVTTVASRSNNQRALEYRSTFANALDLVEQQVAFSESHRGALRWIIAKPLRQPTPPPAAPAHGTLPCLLYRQQDSSCP